MAQSQPTLPLVANLRCGAWYVPQPETTCYFKSTDGHSGAWAFSLTRLNWHVALLAANRGGVFIVDATRRGKTFPVTRSLVVAQDACMSHPVLTRRALHSCPLDECASKAVLISTHMFFMSMYVVYKATPFPNSEMHCAERLLIDRSRHAGCAYKDCAAVGCSCQPCSDSPSAPAAVLTISSIRRNTQALCTMGHRIASPTVDQPE